MARSAVALNKFLTIRAKATTNPVGIYTCPIGVAAIITLCQATNISEGLDAGTYTITGIHSRTDGGAFKFANDEQIPVNDSMNLFPDGRLALETNDVLYFNSNSNAQIDIILSVLETARQ
jgi:hypothetical protein